MAVHLSNNISMVTLQGRWPCCCRRTSPETYFWHNKKMFSTEQQTYSYAAAILLPYHCIAWCLWAHFALGHTGTRNIKKTFILLYIQSHPQHLCSGHMQRLAAGDLSQTHCGREGRDSAVVNEEFTVPWKVFVCSINIPGKSSRLPRDASAVGCNQAGCLSNAARIGCLYIIFEEYKLACSIAFELPPTHLHIAFCSRE